MRGKTEDNQYLTQSGKNGLLKLHGEYKPLNSLVVISCRGEYRGDF